MLKIVHDRGQSKWGIEVYQIYILYFSWEVRIPRLSYIRYSLKR